MESSLWEKALIVAACALAVGFLAFAGKRQFFDHQQSAPAESVQAAVPSEADSTAGTPFSNVAGAERSQSASGESARPVKTKRVKAAATPTPPDRHDCDVLKVGHDRRTRGERQWYIDNCMRLAKNKAAQGGQQSARADLEKQLQAAGFSLAAPPPRRSAGSAGATPPPELTQQVAVAKAVRWIPENTPVMVTVGMDDCTPVWINGHWVVTCNVTLEGCAISYCVASLSVCVYATEPAVVPDRLC